MPTVESPSRFVVTQPIVQRGNARAASTAVVSGEAASEETRPVDARFHAAWAVEASRIAALEGSHEGASPWAKSAKALLECARSEARAGQREAAYRFLQEARRECVAGLDHQSVQNQLVAVAKETELKLRDWRREAVRSLLTNLRADATLHEKREALRAAMELRDEHESNVLYRHRRLSRAVTVTGCALVLSGGLFFALLYFQRGLGLSAGVALSWPVLSLGMLLGSMGACFSALLGFASTSPEQRLPDALTGWSLSLLRPLLGAAAGILGVLLVAAGVVNLGTLGLLVPFSLGFGERAVSRALGRFEKAAK